MRWLKQWWPALAWVAVISWFSTSLFTSANTGRFIIPVLHWMFPSLSLDTLHLIHLLIRKCGHFTEYFILSWLILRGFRRGERVTKMKWALLTILLIFGYASLDEFHQSFVPGRTPAFHDVMIDTSAGIAAQIVAALLFEKQRRKVAASAQPPSTSSE